MQFSELAFEFTGDANPLYTLREQLSAQGKAVVDLISANPGEHGMLFPQDILREAMSRACDAAAVYKPDSLGQRVAREAVADYYRSRISESAEKSHEINAGDIVLTPGTSLSYFYCFKLLAEPGDEILCPQPSYPLLDYIAQLCSVQLSKYELDETKNWAIDFENLTAQINSRSRAIVLISPHNPTGMLASSAEIATLAEIASKHNLPIIADEVFAEFLFDDDELPRPMHSSAPLVFTLNGLSKSLALPGIKFGWMLVTGDKKLVRRFISALEMISDTFLPVNEITQFAVPEIFERGQEFQKQYRDWIKQCREIALGALDGTGLVSPRGGFYITIPVNGNEDDFAVSLLEKEQILVHPGHFYDVSGNHIVCTFVCEHKKLAETFKRIANLALSKAGEPPALRP